MAASDVGPLGVAIALTLLAGFGIAYYEDVAEQRGWHFEIRRPGGTALIIGVAAAVVVTGLIVENLFIAPAAAIAALSSTPLLRRSGRIVSFGVLWVAAVAVAFVLDAEVAAFGMRVPDAIFTGFVLACLASVMREWDAAGSVGWIAALATAAGATALCVGLNHHDDVAFGVLLTGALFAVVSITPAGAGMLGRSGARFFGLTAGGLFIRSATGSPVAAVGVAVGSLLIIVLWALSMPSPYRGRTIAGLIGVAALGAVASFPAAVAMRDIAKPMRDTVEASRGLVTAKPRGGVQEAAAQLQPIADNFRSYADKLDAPAVLPSKFVPFVAANVRAASTGVHAASRLADSARLLLGRINVGSLTMRQGAIVRTELANLTSGLENVQYVVNVSADDVDNTATDLLVPQLRDGLKDLRSQLRDVKKRVDVSVDGALAADRLLGYDEPNRFLVAIQSNSESRATGGYIPNYGIVEMDGGRVKTNVFRRSSELDTRVSKQFLNAPLNYRRRYSQFDVERNWSNINLSPDFPTVASVMADQYKQKSGHGVTSVVGIDAFGLAGLLELTGPVTVPGYPTPISAGNAVRVVLHDQYVVFDNNSTARIDFLGKLGTAVIDKISNGGITDFLAAAPVIDDLTTQKRIQFWTAEDNTYKFFRETNSDGRVPRRGSDAVMVTTQNAAGNKMDYYLDRDIEYRPTVRRSGNGLFVDAQLTIKLINRTPPAGDPKYIVGPNVDGYRVGQSRVWMTIYSPLELQASTLDGKELVLPGQPELQRIAYSAFIDLPPGATRTIVVRLTGQIPHARRYALDLFRQPMVRPDNVAIHVDGAGPNGRFDQQGPLERDVYFALQTGS